jgi:hypothetical protein
MQPNATPDGPLRTVAILAAIALVAAPATAASWTLDGSADPADTSQSEDWPSLEEADIRPGVRVVTGGQCTSSFLFEDQATGDLFLGLASHCVDEVGQEADIYNVSDEPFATGTVAYRSFDHTDAHDFALVEIPDEVADRAHPAVLQFGGPTGLADSDAFTVGEHVVSYGNSQLRQGLEPTNPREGYLTNPGEQESDITALTPGIPGDSGSGVMDDQGRALGVLITVGVSASVGTDGAGTGTNGITNLDVALAFAEDQTGMDLELQTYEQLDGGQLPNAPAP